MWPLLLKGASYACLKHKVVQKPRSGALWVEGGKVGSFLGAKQIRLKVRDPWEILMELGLLVCGGVGGGGRTQELSAYFSWQRAAP